MHTRTEETEIPRYPFEPDPATGHPTFRIHKNDSSINYKKADFLVPHRRDYYFMAFVRKGGSRHWIDMTPYVLRSNVYCFTDPHQVHLKEVNECLSGVTLSFTEEFLALDESGSLKELPVIQNPWNAHLLELGEAEVVFIEQILEQIHTEYHGKSKWQQGMLLAYMKVLLIYLSRLCMEQFSKEEALPGKELLKNYLTHINEHYAEAHEVADYAAMMNISAGHLSDVIKEQSGKPPIAHIHERLLVEARRFLFHTNLSVKEIAYTLGFEDDSYFNRFFRRLAGQTPVAYREATRKMYH